MTFALCAFVALHPSSDQGVAADGQQLPTIFLVEEDHLSFSGQLTQAERLFDLYFNRSVHDVLLEGFVGDLLPVGGLIASLPIGARDSIHENMFASRMLRNYMPTVAPASQSQRFSIAFPEFIQGNVSAAEFVASIIPARLHPGENKYTYDVPHDFELALCDNLDEKIRKEASTDSSGLDGGDARELKDRYERIHEMSSWAGSYEAEYDAYISLLLRLLSSKDSGWKTLRTVWDDACGPSARAMVLSPERLLEIYRKAETLKTWGYKSGWWEKDMRFLQARAEASDEIARRAIALAKGLNRNLAVVVGVGHTARIQDLLRKDGTIRLVVIGLQTDFGELGSLRLSPYGWQYKQEGRPNSEDGLDDRLRWVEALRRPAPVVQSTLYQSRHELAAISDRLVRALYEYAEKRSANAAAASELKGRFVLVDAKSAEPVRVASSEGTEGVLVGFLLRAETRLHGTRESLWLAARRSNYLLPPTEARDGTISFGSVQEFFLRLKKMSWKQHEEQFREGLLKSEGDDPHDTSFSPVRSRLATLSLEVRVFASMLKEKAERSLRSNYPLL
jgi:hypothetical protein